MSSKGIQFITEEDTGVELQHINVKLLLTEQEGIELQAVIPVFHSWIQEQAFDELMLDVADYSHVKDGPGVLLIGHEADYGIDNTDGRLGVRYNRKALLDGNNQDKLRQALRSALNAALRLEQDASLKENFKFGGRELELIINDRMIAPNGEETQVALDPEFRRFFDNLFGQGKYSCHYETDPRRLFGVRIRALQTFSPQTLFQMLSQEVQA
jgi:hypothetical protein